MKRVQADVNPEPRQSAAETAADRGNYIAIAVADGVATLDGQIESLSHKRLAELLAWWVPGTRDVVNGIELKPYEDDSDDEITDAVTMALEKDRHDSIRVITRNSVVTIEGVVPTATRRRWQKLTPSISSMSMASSTICAALKSSWMRKENQTIR